MSDEICALFEYDRWATERILAAAGELTADQLSRDLGSSFGSVFRTLEHIAGADWIWLERWLGRSPTTRPPPMLPDLDALSSRWRRVHAERMSYLQKLPAGAADANVRYQTIAGERHSAPLRQLMHHVVNHSTYHRGQVATMLRQLGTVPPATDLILYYRANGG